MFGSRRRLARSKVGSSTKVVPTTSNTQQSVQLPQYLQDAGQAAVSKATTMSNTPFQQYTGQLVAPLSDNQNSAVTTAANDTTAGQGALGTAKGALGAAGTVAAGSVGSGTGALNGAATLFGQQGASALNSQGTGAPSGDLDAQLAALAGGSATGSQTAGNADLAQARSLNTSSAAPISAADISSYFNPYVQQALDPQIAALQKQGGINQVALQNKSAMSGSFGGSREGIEESQNNNDLLQQISAATGTGYQNAYNSALSAAQAQQEAENRAAGTAIQTGTAADSQANDALSRLTQAASSAGAAGTTQSDLATADQNRLSSAGTNAMNLGNAQSALSTADVNRLLSLVNPANSTATTESSLDNDALNRLLTTGNLQQTQNQNVDNANYQQFQNQVNWPQQQLNALLAAAGGVPYGTNTTSNTQGTQVVQSPSILGQIVGAGASVAGAIAGSARDSKENFGDVDDEDILERLASIPVSTYDYKPEAQALLRDDGSRKIGPMADDWAREFGGNPNIIPMPQVIGALISSVRALDKRTSSNDGDILAEFRRMAA